MDFKRLEVFLLFSIFIINMVFFVLLIQPSILGNVIGNNEFARRENVSNFINEEDILIGKEQVVITIDNPRLVRYDSSGSMIPVLDKGFRGIVVQPKSPEELIVGEIITFERGQELIVHRIVEKGIDEKGVYFITKGDNNNFVDGKIRFSEIRSVLVAIIY